MNRQYGTPPPIPSEARYKRPVEPPPIPPAARQERRPTPPPIPQEALVPREHRLTGESALRHDRDQRDLPTPERTLERGVTPQGTFVLRSYWGGERSKYRENQDTAAVLTTAKGETILVVNDGMGGEGGGFEASRIALAAQLAAFQAGKDTTAAIYAADRAIKQSGIQESSRGAGSTGVFARISETGMLDMRAIGDAKGIAYRPSLKEQDGVLTETLVQNAPTFNADGDATYDPIGKTQANIVTAAMGRLGDPTEYREGTKEHRFTTPAVCEPQQLEAGDIIVLGSDGLWDTVSRYEVLNLLKQYAADPNKLEQALFDLANNRQNSTQPFTRENAQNDVERVTPPAKPKGDNITILVTRYSGAQSAENKRAA